MEKNQAQPIKLDKKTIAKQTMRVSMIMLGTLTMAIGNMAFVNPYNIVPGGFTGFAIILSMTVLKGVITPGILALILNAPLFVVAFKVKGARFSLFSLVGTVSYSVFIDLIPLILAGVDMSRVTQGEQILATIYGGVFMGIGYGIIIRQGGSTGGSDTLANILNAKKPGMSFGTILLLIDGLVVILSGIAFSIQGGGIEAGIPPALLAFVVIFISAKIADYVIEGKRSTRAYYILCSDPEAMSKVILEKLNRGVTGIKATGMFTHVDKHILMCIILRTQSPMLKQVVFELDPKAFVYSCNIPEVYGQGFMTPTLKKQAQKRKLQVIQEQVAFASVSESMQEIEAKIERLQELEAKVSMIETDLTDLAEIVQQVQEDDTSSSN